MNCELYYAYYGEAPWPINDEEYCEHLDDYILVTDLKTISFDAQDGTVEDMWDSLQDYLKFNSKRVYIVRVA